MRTGIFFRRSSLRTLFIAFPAVFLQLSCSVSCFLHPRQEADAFLSILTYNAQTLFDDVSDGTEYEGFDPASGAWNEERYRRRLESVASAIQAAAEGGPDVVALQEVESRKVLDDLVSGFLSRNGYAHRAMTSLSGSALGVGVLSRYPIVLIRSHALFSGNESHPGRDILEVAIEFDGTQLVLFNNHWKSKTGGAVETEPIRLHAAGILARLLRVRLACEPEADILVLGDLNESADEFLRVGRAYQTALIPESEEVPCGYHEKSIFIAGTGAVSGPSADQAAGEGSGDGCAAPKVVLYSPWGMDGAPGSYRYGGQWLTLDHFLLSPGLLDEKDFSIAEFRVVRDAFMSGREGEPLRWDSVSGKGYSDHFPLLLVLRKVPQELR